jgi:hypothetical protein
MIKKYTYFLLIILLSSCDYFDPTVAGPPSMRWMFDGPKKEEGKTYPPMYVDGWKDGCHTGVSANTNAYYKYYYTFKQDAYKAQDPVYYKGWKDAFNYCGRYIYQYNRKIGF